ncbi:other/AgaK1 protein kinase [Coprinopsis cinerea AmutBmut pab1-1]|nr:other/AgaK1 protein kinase [Coprinopsis cinerea AmutBmut pab1-1]
MPVQPGPASPSSPTHSEHDENVVSELLELLLEDLARDSPPPSPPAPPAPEPEPDYSYLLRDGELYWRDHYDWFLEKGYRLRPRYKPNWIPSWIEKPDKFQGESEDSLAFIHRNLNDAIQISQDRHVVLKRISRSRAPEEVSILDYFSKEPWASQLENHCVPLVEVLRPPGDPDHDVVVLPVLRQYDNPEFETIGEAIDFIRQVLEGFTFLHEHRVAHRDVKVENVMMDPKAMQFQRFHFCAHEMPHEFEKSVDTKHISWKFSRTERRPKYYIIDFGHASQYTDEQMPPLEWVDVASDPSLPEIKARHKPWNPFPIDVYYVGNFIRMEFLDGHDLNDSRTGCFGFEFLRPLVEAMTKEDPDERITMKDALENFDVIVSTLNCGTLRSRIVRMPGVEMPAEGFIDTVTRTASHWCRTIKYITKGLPPIPSEPIPDESNSSN